MEGDVAHSSRKMLLRPQLKPEFKERAVAIINDIVYAMHIIGRNTDEFLKLYYLQRKEVYSIQGLQNTDVIFDKKTILKALQVVQGLPARNADPIMDRMRAVYGEVFLPLLSEDDKRDMNRKCLSHILDYTATEKTTNYENVICSLYRRSVEQAVNLYTRKAVVEKSIRRNMRGPARLEALRAIRWKAKNIKMDLLFPMPDDHRRVEDLMTVAWVTDVRRSIYSEALYIYIVTQRNGFLYEEEFEEKWLNTRPLQFFDGLFNANCYIEEMGGKPVRTLYVLQ